ncbi:MAG: acyl-CoA dehydrogenase family protein [Acidimicrobiia bacterium]|nr:acyl-CoA dehydrogenase family protein [Acidimicrobiia bacterium]
MTTTTERDLVEEQLERLLADHDPAGPHTEFLGAQFDHGLAWVWFPEGLGGLGVSRNLQRVVDERLQEVGAPRAATYNLLGIGMGAPVLMEYGTEEQQRRWLRPMFACEEIWCQMFSEPGAGSDVAALATRAVRDGDEWVVNGQKVWTTIAHVSKWGMLVARTDPDVPKHQGMSYFVVDMEADGVDVRPLRQITGEAEFNEVYFDDVRVPDANRIGDVGDGWRVALATLMNERVAIGGTVLPRGGGPIGDLVEVWTDHGGDEAARDEVARLWVEFEAARLTNLRASQNRRRGTPGPEGSTAKLVYAELNKRIYETATDLMGAEAMLYPSYEMTRPGEVSGIDDIRKAFLRARANSIEGGTSEIMKNILGERVLGLPGEPRVDKDLPWSEVPR